MVYTVDFTLNSLNLCSYNAGTHHENITSIDVKEPAEEEDSDSDIETVIRKAEQNYQRFRHQFSDLMDPSQEEELEKMAALGLPTVLITSKCNEIDDVADYSETTPSNRIKRKRSNLRDVPSDPEEDLLVAKAIECAEDIVTVINNLKGVQLGYAAGMPGKWECTEEDVACESERDPFSEAIRALQIKGRAFANVDWQAYWGEHGPQMLVSAWCTAYPHIPVSRVVEVCEAHFLSGVTPDVGQTTEPKSPEEENEISDEDLKQTWLDFYNQSYWYTYSVFCSWGSHEEDPGDGKHVAKEPCHDEEETHEQKPAQEDVEDNTEEVENQATVEEITNTSLLNDEVLNLSEEGDDELPLETSERDLSQESQSPCNSEHDSYDAYSGWEGRELDGTASEEDVVRKEEHEPSETVGERKLCNLEDSTVKDDDMEEGEINDSENYGIHDLAGDYCSSEDFSKEENHSMLGHTDDPSVESEIRTAIVSSEK